jgi:hypothetical protein
MKAFKVFFAIVFAMMLGMNGVWGQVSLITLGTAVTENFNSMGISNTASLPTGFKFGTGADWTSSSNTTATTQRAGTSGANVVTGSSSGGAYNWANGATASSTDRAVGFLTSGGYVSPRTIFYAFTNNTGSTVTELVLSWDYEKYRSGSRAFAWTFFYGSDETSITTAAIDGNHNYVADANNTTVYDPPTVVSKSLTISGLSIANSSTYYLRWVYTGSGGSTNAHGLGIDNFSITPRTTPSSPTITSITPGNGQLSVAFTNPSSNGGSSITTYKYSTDGGANWQTRASGTTESPLDISTVSSDGTTSLSNGTSYNVQIRAVNAAGDGTASSTKQATPATTTYYSKSSVDLSALTSWTSNADGTGANPSDFSTSNVVYQINTSTATIGASWTVTGSNTAVVVGDGANATDFSIPTGTSLILQGNLTNNSTISGSGTVVMNGSSAQTISGIGTISNLEINNSSGVTISSGSNMQSLTGVLTPTVGTLTTNGNLTLKSSSTTTARVAAGSSSGGYVSGNVSIERYFASNKQAWRMVTAPVTGALAGSYIYNHWQSSTTDGATGVEIWGPGGTTAPTGSGGANGLAYHATVSSMREWNNNPSNPAYANVTDTKSTPLFTEDGTNPKSYFLFVAGPLGNGSVPASYSAVKVRATGGLRQGNQSFSITNAQAGRYFMVGNPYASPVSHGEVNMVNVDNPIWLWDPNLSGANGVGGYVSFDRTAKTYSVLSGQSGTGLVYTGTNTSDYTRLQSGQAFFVRATNTANLSVNFTEADKSSSSTNMVLRSGSNFQAEKMRVTLQRNSNGEYITTDGAVAFFYTGGATEVNEMDGHKLLNASNNIMFRRNGTNLTFEHRPLVESTDTLFLNLRSTSTGAYRLILTGSDFDNSNKLIPVLQDTYLNKEQILKLDTSVNYDFEIDGNATASSGERFRIVFSSKATEPLEFDPRHTIQGYPNPVRTGGQLSLKFNDRPAGNYTVVFNSLQGVRVQQQVVQHAGGTAVQSIKLSSKLTPGSYLVNILDASSRNVESLKVIIQ